jgi:hypothetical protein
MEIFTVVLDQDADIEDIYGIYSTKQKAIEVCENYNNDFYKLYCYKSIIDIPGHELIWENAESTEIGTKPKLPNKKIELPKCTICDKEVFTGHDYAYQYNGQIYRHLDCLSWASG